MSIVSRILTRRKSQRKAKTAIKSRLNSVYGYRLPLRAIFQGLILPWQEEPFPANLVSGLYYGSISSNSCRRDERYRAAEFIAADPLHDGIAQTSQFAVEPGFVATGPILLGLLYLSSERVSS